MRRPRHKLEVSTFPFLAVLLCAMGAMVLFLLVMDRRAKIVAKTKAREALEERIAARGMDDAARLAEWERQREALHQALLDQQSELHGEQGEVRQLLVESRQKLHAKQTEREKLQQATAVANAKLLQRKVELAEKQAGFQKSAEKETVARSELVRLGADVLDLEKALADLKALKKRERQTFSLVPYRGKRGDNRNPIYIECAADGLIFHPERQALSRAELNPVRLRSEVERRSGRLEREAKKEKETQEPAPLRGPYVLFLIRPDGITNYYQALAFLKGFQIDFGYEVVDQHWVLDFNAPTALAGASPWKATPAGTAKNAKPPAIAAVNPRGNPAPLSSDSSVRVGSSPLAGLPSTPPPAPGVNGPSAVSAPGVVGKIGTQGPHLPGAAATGSAGASNSVPGLGGFGVNGPNNGPPGVGTPGLPIAGAVGPAPGGPPGPASPFQDISVGGPSGAQPSGNGDGSMARLLPVGKIPPPVSLVKAGPGLPVGGVAATPRPISSAVGLMGNPVSSGAPNNAPSGNFGGAAGIPGQFGSPGSGGATQGAGNQIGLPGQGPGGTPGTPGMGSGTSGVPGQGAGPGARFPGQGTGGTPGQGSADAAGVPGQPPGLPGTPGSQGSNPGGGGGLPGPGNGGASGASGQGTAGSAGTPGQGGSEPGAPGQAGSAPASSPGPGSPGAPGTPSSIPNITIGAPGPRASGPPPPDAPGATGMPVAGSAPSGPSPFPPSGSGSDSGGSSDASSIPPVLRPPSYGPSVPATADKKPRPVAPPLGVILGNRDFVVTITCYSDHVTIFPGGKQHWWKGPTAVQADTAVVQNVQGLIAGRQRSVREGEPPYRPTIRFQLAPDGLNSFLRVYPRLVALKVPMTRENLED